MPPEAFDPSEATHHDLLDLVTELESIQDSVCLCARPVAEFSAMKRGWTFRLQESRVSVDQGLLADLIRALSYGLTLVGYQH